MSERALSIRQPSAYLAGTLHGDAFFRRSGGSRGRHGYLCLRVADRDHADAFAEAATLLYGRPVKVASDERGYWHVRTYDTGGRAAELIAADFDTSEHRAAWLRGLFDGDGNVRCAPRPDRGPRSWDRRVSIYSTNKATLETAARYLASLDLPTRRSEQTASAQHLGTKQVYELALLHGRERFTRFAEVVGSSIARKQTRLSLLPQTYGGVGHESLVH